MKVGFYTWGSCFVESPGMGGPDPYSRHHNAADYERAYKAMFEWAKLADSLGYNAYWLTEHHFQREGYEVIPNVLLMATAFAQHTKNLTFGSFFHVVPTWHPLRMAEDFATADILTGGRVVFGAGRGSVEREARVFGASFGRGGEAADLENRELFEEQMEIMRLAWEEPEFSFHGKHYTIPPEGILNTGNAQTGRPWTKISLVPQPVRPIKVYQACNSMATVEMCAKAMNTGVIAIGGGIEKTREKWAAFGEALERYHGRTFRKGENRLLVASVHIGETYEAAMEELRGPAVERARFLARQRPVGIQADGTPFPVDYVPTLEELMNRGNMFVGTVDDVRDRLVAVCEELGVEELAIEMGFPGMLEDVVSNQIRVFAAGVRPALDKIGVNVAEPAMAAA